MRISDWSSDVCSSDLKPSQVIHIDIDPNQIGKIFQPSLGINADAKVVLRQLIARVERDGLGRSTDPAKLDSIATSKKKWFDYQAKISSNGGTGVKINTSKLISTMSETFSNVQILEDRK